MKQDKHHNGFIYYTEYKSSLGILNKIERQQQQQKKKKHKILLKLLIYQEPLSPLSLLYRFSAFFPPNTGSRLKIVLCSFLEELPDVGCTCVLFFSVFSVTFIPKHFNRIKVH